GGARFRRAGSDNSGCVAIMAAATETGAESRQQREAVQSPPPASRARSDPRRRSQCGRSTELGRPGRGAMTRGLKKRIGAGEFALTAEIGPPLSARADALLAEASLLRGRVDAINVTDAASGRTTMSSFASAAILASSGYEPILQVTCRDRNRIALAGDLLGASAQ